MTTIIVSQIERDSIYKLIEAGKRLDGRKFDEYRKIELDIGVYKRAEGSARVKIGNTLVACGVKIGEAVPYPDSPDEGTLTTTAELVPMASPTFQPGPPDENAIELARVVDRGIREAKTIDLKKLCITPGEKVKSVFVDTYVLDYDGNFMDAAALGAIAALWNTKMPDGKKLPVSKKPIANTFVKIAGKILLDASLDEDRVMEARLTVTTDEDGNVVAMQKAAPGFWTSEEVMECVKIAFRKGKELRHLLK